MDRANRTFRRRQRGKDAFLTSQLENPLTNLEDETLLCGMPECRNWGHIFPTLILLASCGHRSCEQCVDTLLSLPEEERICGVCRDERQRHDDAVVSVEQNDAEPRHIPPNKIIAREDCTVVDNNPEISLLKLQVCPNGCILDGTRIHVMEREHMDTCEKQQVMCETCYNWMMLSVFDAHVCVDSTDNTEQPALGSACYNCHHTVRGDRISHHLTCVGNKCPSGCELDEDESFVDHLNSADTWKAHRKLFLEKMADIGISSGQLIAGVPAEDPNALGMFLIKCLTKLQDFRTMQAEEEAESAAEARKQLTDRLFTLDELMRTLG